MSFYDPLETRDQEERERALLDRLPSQIAYAKEKTHHFFQLLAGISPYDIHNRDALARLPVTRKHDLIALQQQTIRAGEGNPLGVERVTKDRMAQCLHMHAQLMCSTRLRDQRQTRCIVVQIANKNFVAG